MRSVKIDFSTDGAVTGISLLVNSDRDQALLERRLEEMFRAPAWRWINRLLVGGRLGENKLKNARRIK